MQTSRLPNATLHILHPIHRRLHTSESLDDALMKSILEHFRSGYCRRVNDSQASRRRDLFEEKTSGKEGQFGRVGLKSDNFMECRVHFVDQLDLRDVFRHNTSERDGVTFSTDGVRIHIIVHCSKDETELENASLQQLNLRLLWKIHESVDAFRELNDHFDKWFELFREQFPSASTIQMGQSVWINVADRIPASV